VKVYDPQGSRRISRGKPIVNLLQMQADEKNQRGTCRVQVRLLKTARFFLSLEGGQENQCCSILSNPRRPYYRGIALDEGDKSSSASY
jgi:hypothetical protein